MEIHQVSIHFLKTRSKRTVVLHVIGDLRSKCDNAIAIENALRIRENPSAFGLHPFIVVGANPVLAKIHQVAVHFLKARGVGAITLHVIGDLRSKRDDAVMIQLAFGIRKYPAAFGLYPCIIVRADTIFPKIHQPSAHRLKSRGIRAFVIHIVGYFRTERNNLISI